MRRGLLWTVVAVSSAYLGIVTWGIASSLEDPARAAFGDLSSALWIFVMVPAVVVAGILILWKRPGNRIGQLLVLAGIVNFVIPTILEIPTVIFYHESGAQPWMWAPMWLSNTLNSAGAVIIASIIVRLPDGDYRLPRDRRLIQWAWVTVTFPSLVLVSSPLVITHSLAFPGVGDISSPLFIEWLQPLNGTFTALVAVAYLVFPLAIAFQVLRYRKASTRERKQVRWVLYGGTLSILLGLVPFALGEVGLTPELEHSMLATALFTALPLLLFPASIVIAVLEPKWIDVDIVIRKSFVYGALSFVILLLYIGAAAAFGLAAGARLQIELAIFLTVIVAVLFQPARRWLQDLADRWVFGDRPSNYQAVAELGATIEETPDPTDLLPRLVDTVQRALRSRWVRAELDDGESTAVGEMTGDAVLSVPIVNGSETLGRIECGPTQRGAVGPEEEQLVHTLAGQVGLAVANARLASRIVTSAEAERRRIERNIHDGAQQELVALVARLGMARNAAERDDLSPAALEALQNEAQRILAELRELAQGIHPSVLSDGGLVEAVEERCSHLPIQVSVASPPELRRQRFPDDVEGAAYFFVTESLANVLKHSNASVAEVSMRQTNGRLSLEVVDNGKGFDPAVTRQNGLIGLKDRISALGGTVRIASRPGTGTRVEAVLPVE